MTQINDIMPKVARKNNDPYAPPIKPMRAMIATMRQEEADKNGLAAVEQAITDFQGAVTAEVEATQKVAVIGEHTKALISRHTAAADAELVRVFAQMQEVQKHLVERDAKLRAEIDDFTKLSEAVAEVAKIISGSLEKWREGQRDQ